jgi:hypothetical protein
MMGIKHRSEENDSFTPPPLTSAFVSDEWERLERETPTLSTGQQKVDLDAVFRMVLAQAWSDCP